MPPGGRELTVSDGSIRVGFALTPSNWLGGRNYMRSLFAALRLLPETPITPVLFAGLEGEDVASDFPDVEVVRSSLLDRKSPAWFARRVVAKTTSQDILLRRLLKRNGVSVLSHSFHLGFDPGKHPDVKTIGWIADLQHVRMPEFFSATERLNRDREYRSLCARCDKVIVSSECARADLCTFVPEYAHKMELLRFVASSTPLARATCLSDLQQKYDFTGPYFLLPNQFWAHKNHRIVISALAELKKQQTPMLVLATGSISDPRNPTYFSSLMQYAEESTVLDCFRVLGQIPYDDIVGLMQHAIAFINPSRFEGWSTSVEEAKSMGKQIVLSDLPVHREQAPERGIYFPAEDPIALAEAMRVAYDEFDDQRDAVMQEKAGTQFVERQRGFGETYQHIVENV